ncbi:hypothetical protein ACOSQ3_029280 [Xanthoceras sorbifolium]
MKESHTVLVSGPKEIGYDIEERTTSRIEEEVFARFQEVSKGKGGAPSESAVVRRKCKFTTVIAKDEPDQIKRSLKNVTWAAVPVSFMLLLPDTVREFTPPPPPSAKQKGYMSGKDSEGLVNCSLRLRSYRKGKDPTDVMTTEPAGMDKASILDVVVLPSLGGEGLGAQVDDFSHIAPLSVDDILARTAAMKVSLRDRAGIERFLSNINVAAKDRMSFFKRMMPRRRSGMLYGSKLQL